MKKTSLIISLILFSSMFTIINNPVAALTVGSAVNTKIVSPLPLNLPLLVAKDDTATTNEDTPVRINVMSNDSYTGVGSPRVTSVTTPSSGTVVINVDNTITYTPNLNFFGSDSFDYILSDGTGLLTDTATVSVTVNDVMKLINKVSSGLVAFDPLNNETKTRQDLEANQSYWHYGGSATALNAPVDFFKDNQGLYIGVQAPANGTYAGYYAVTPLTNAALFHAVISTSVNIIDGDFFQNGAYVQTGNGKINYVTCVSITSTTGTTWHIIRTFGNFTQATQAEVLWSNFSPNQPLTRDCTIITNGTNYLKVYLDGIKVYESNTLDLQMPAPFLYFLEPQNSHTKKLYGIYKDFYIASDENIKVINNPVNAARADVVDTSGKMLASAPVTSETTINIGQYHFPLAASIKVYDINNILLASTSSPVSMTGGDVYSVSQ